MEQLKEAIQKLVTTDHYYYEIILDDVKK